MSCKLVRTFISTVAMLVAFSPASAQSITVKVHRDLSQPTLCPRDSDPNTPEPPCTETYTYSSGSDITINVSSCIDAINIYGRSSVDVGLVTINGSGIGASNRLEIILGGGVAPTSSVSGEALNRATEVRLRTSVIPRGVAEGSATHAAGRLVAPGLRGSA